MRPSPSAVLLVVAGGTVSRAAITRTARLAAGAQVTVVGVTQGLCSETEQVRQTVAVAITALENTGVMAHAHIAASGSPARAIARLARTRGARIVVLDQRGEMVAELRRRIYGSGITVLSAAEPASLRPPAWPS